MRAHGSYHHAFEKISQDLISIINVYYVKRQGSALWPVRDLYRPQRPATLHHIRKHTTFIVTSHSLPLRLISSNIGYAIKGKSALLKTTTSSAITTNLPYEILIDLLTTLCYYFRLVELGQFRNIIYIIVFD